MIALTRITWQLSTAVFASILLLDATLRNNIETVGSVGSALDQSFDFIVVGAGSAGAIVAARLAETNASVLLLEAGGEQPFKASIPWFHLWLAGSPIFWAFQTSGGCGNAYEEQQNRW